MNAVNLLPEKHRPRKPTGGQGRGSYIALGVLGAVLVALLVYVFTLNSINDSKTKITEATVEAAQLNAQANSLGPYGDFAKIKTERVKSVQQLAQERFDYERLVRELAHVLPTDVWVVNATASADTANTTTTASASTPTTSTPGGSSLTLQGCARDQNQVAVTLVRLRQLQGATDVSLDHSTSGEPAPNGGAAAAPAAPSGGSGDSGCGTTHGKPNYSFIAKVEFAPVSPSNDGSGVPNRLGGGA
jgi:Tfp pilus assembly protein PilN